MHREFHHSLFVLVTDSGLIILRADLNKALPVRKQVSVMKSFLFFPVGLRDIGQHRRKAGERIQVSVRVDAQRLPISTEILARNHLTPWIDLLIYVRDIPECPQTDSRRTSGRKVII